MSSQYPISTANVQSVLHIYILCPVHTEIHKAKCPDGIPNVYSPCPAFTPFLQPTFREYSIATAEILTKLHPCSTSTVSTPSLLSMSSQYTISSSYPCPVRIPLSCQLLVRIPPLLPISSPNFSNRARLNIRQNFFSLRIIDIWNDLPQKIIPTPENNRLSRHQVF